MKSLHFNIILGLAVVAFLLAVDETDRSTLAFLGIKAISAAMMIGTFFLAKHWHAKGYFKDIDEYCKDAE